MKDFNKRVDAVRAASSLLLLSAPTGLALPTSPARAAAPRPPAVRVRIAVEPFGYGGISPWWEGDWQIGREMSSLIADDLLRQSGFDVHSTGSRTPYGTALRGSITRFDLDSDSIGTSERSGDRYGGRRRRGGGTLFGIGFTETRASVELSCQLVDVASGRVLRTFRAKGKSSKGTFSGFGRNRGSSIYAEGIDFHSRAFQDTLLGEATRKCVADLDVQLSRSAGSLDLPSAPLDVSGKVADVDDDTLTVNVGASQGVRVGDTLSVEAVMKVIRDPDTGQVIDERIERLGTIHVAAVTARTATGRFDGKALPKVGDRVRLD